MKCKHCDGTGVMLYAKSQWEKEDYNECPTCDGSGYVCDECGDPLPSHHVRLCDPCWRKANPAQPDTMLIRDAKNYPDEREGK
jgi:RecJ-like exonuclease